VTPPSSGSDKPGTPGQWVRSNLVALGSAAVLAVYAAGYARTEAAAKRFEGEDTGRRRPAPAGPGSVVDAAEPGPVAAAAAKPVEARPAAGGSAAPAAPNGVDHAAATPAKRATTVAAAPAPAASAKPTEVAQAPAPSKPAPTPAPAAAPAAATAPSAADSAAQARPKWKDGVYMGWGSSRHGDIQAAVEIKDGEILSASIAQCLTQYSCSWIDALPPQVVTRQSAEVDYVSGATQSSNAFYYAVVNALKLAK